MLRTCIGSDGTNAKNYQNFAENKIPFQNGNGDCRGGHKSGTQSRVQNHRGYNGGDIQWGPNGETNVKETISDLLPEEIPGLPRHRPGEYSPR